MRCVGFGLLAILLLACGTDEPVDPNGSQTLPFGPLSIPAHTEDLSQCVALTLHNTDDVYVNEVELTTGPGFHHSNWLWVPEHSFDGPDGLFKCADRDYDQVAAGILGGVFFAQSTQAEHEVQAFPEGMAIKLPPHAKLVAQVHLLNNGDEALELQPKIGFQAIAAESVTKKLASITFEYHPLALPPQHKSKVSVECDLGPRHMELFGTLPDFNVYYALAHYHAWGTGLTIEAVKPDGAAATIYSTASGVGGELGGLVAPAFSMVGYTKLRLSCDYYNSTNGMLYYGNGNGEMCIFNAFSDSTYAWAGGALDTDISGTGTPVGDTMTFTHACQVYAVESK